MEEKLLVVLKKLDSQKMTVKDAHKEIVEICKGDAEYDDDKRI